MEPIKYETALLLREKILSHNFSIYGKYAYSLNTKELVSYLQNNLFAVVGEDIFYDDDNKHYFIPAPLQEEVIEWLWNEHKIYVQSTLQLANELCHDHNFSIIIKISENRFVIRSKECDKRFANRNEAMEYGIIEALKLINYGTK